MFDVVGVGDIDIDIYVQLDKIPDYDEKLLANNHDFHAGGMVANTLVALSRLENKCVLHAPIGEDVFGQLAEQDLLENSVDASGLVHKPDGSTYFCIVMLDDIGEKSLIVVPTDSMALDAAEIKKDVICSAKHMHTTLFKDALVALEMAKSCGLTVSMDIEPSSLNRGSEDWVHEVLKMLDIVFIGENAAQTIANGKSPADNAKIISSLGPKIVCHTLGNRGGVIAEAGSGALCEYPSFNVPVVDTTGAGDCFAAGYIHGYLKGWTVEKTAQFASAVAAINVMSMGGHTGAPYLADVKQFLINNKI